MESSQLVKFLTSGKFITKFNVLLCISLSETLFWTGARGRIPITSSSTAICLSSILGLLDENISLAYFVFLWRPVVSSVLKTGVKLTNIVCPTMWADKSTVKVEPFDIPSQQCGNVCDQHDHTKFVFWFLSNISDQQMCA